MRIFHHDRRLWAPNDGGGGDGGGNGGGDGGGGDGGGGGSWQDSLPDDLRGNAAFQNITSVEGLAREHINVQGLIGKKGLIPPEADAGEEAIGKFYASLPEHLRAPEKVEGYDLKGFKPPEGMPWSEGVQGGMLAEMHALNLPSFAVTRLMSKYAELQGGEYKSLVENVEGAAAKARQELEAELGDGFKERDAKVQQAATKMFGDKFEDARNLRLLDGTYLLDNPVMFRAINAIADGLLEGDSNLGPGGGGGGNVNTKEGAQAEIDRIRKAAREDPKHPFNDSQHPEHRAVHKRLSSLYSVVYPGDQVD